LDLREISNAQVHVSKSFIDKSVTIRGDLSFVDTLEIQGSVLGNVVSNSSSISFLIIGKDSEIRGDVASSHVVVSGKLIGHINAQHVVIEETAVILGNVNYKSIEVHSGAKIDGSMSTSKPAENIVLKSNNPKNTLEVDVPKKLNPVASVVKIPAKHIEIAA
jgi:cytoskeletal protein CcmA (bactofilin family)